MSNPVQTPSSSNEIITQDQKLLASLSLTPGLDTTTLNTTDSTNMMASPELALVWPLTDFASTTCSRPIATILRFLHFHALVARPTTPPTILIQTPEDLGNGRLEDEQLFVQLVREACRDRLDQILEKSVHIDVKTQKVTELSAKTEVARRLQTMPRELDL